MRFRVTGVPLVTAILLALSAPHAWAANSSPVSRSASPAVSARASGTLWQGALTPIASAAQGSGYTIPPTGTGALGISKNSWGKASDVANGIAALAAGVAVYATGVAAGAAIPTLGLSVPTAGTVALVSGLVSAGAWGVGAVFSYLSRDPADRNFRSIFKPVFAHVPPIHVPSARFARVGSALHRLLQGELRVTELATAFVTSTNRATGARAAHSAIWVRRQRQAAAGYARQAATLLFGFESQRDAVEHALLAAGVDLTLTAQQEGATQSQAGTQALPQIVTNALKTLTRGTVAASLKRRILNFAAFKSSLTHSAPQAVHFPADLPAPSFALAEDRVAGALLGYANSVTKTPRRKHG